MRFKSYQVKALHDRIRQNQEYMKHAFKVLCEDRQKYMNLLGFHRQELKEILKHIGGKLPDLSVKQ